MDPSHMDPSHELLLKMYQLTKEEMRAFITASLLQTVFLMFTAIGLSLWYFLQSGESEFVKLRRIASSNVSIFFIGLLIFSTMNLLAISQRDIIHYGYLNRAIEQELLGDDVARLGIEYRTFAEYQASISKDKGMGGLFTDASTSLFLGYLKKCNLTHQSARSILDIVIGSAFLLALLLSVVLKMRNFLWVLKMGNFSWLIFALGFVIVFFSVFALHYTFLTMTNYTC